MKDRRVQTEAFFETSSRAMMIMGHGEVRLLAWGRLMETRSAAGPIAGGAMPSLPYSRSDVYCHQHLLGVLLRRWSFEPAG